MTTRSPAKSLSPTSGQEARVLVPLENLLPNPYQPATRLKVSEEVAEQFGRSILEHGLIVTPVGRRADKPGYFECGDGWLRRAGFEWLTHFGKDLTGLDAAKADQIKSGFYKTIPLDVRPLTDQQMADLVMEANEIRKDLTDLELAEFYKRYLEDFKISQAELARRHSCSQGEIANTIRLLELPEAVKAKVISQEISSTHARQLLRLNSLPDRQAEHLKNTIEHHLTVADLDREISRGLYDNSKPLTKGARSWPLVAFDVAECQKCEFNQEIADPYGDRKKAARCIKPTCWEKKQTTAEKAAAAAHQMDVEKKAAKSGKGGQKVLTDKDIKYSERMGMSDYRKKLDNAAECDACKKKALYSYTDGTKPVEVCLNPACYRKKQVTKTTNENKSKREKDKALSTRVIQICDRTSKNRYGALVIAAMYLVDHMDSKVRDDIGPYFPNLPHDDKKRLDKDVLMARLPGMDEPKVVALISAIILSHSRRRDEYSDFSIELNENGMTVVSILEDRYTAHAAQNAAWQKANCTGCKDSRPELIETGEPCCKDNWQRTRVKDGVCPESPIQKKAPAAGPLRDATEGCEDGRCRVCGADCRGIIGDEEPCMESAKCPWPEDDLCPACAAKEKNAGAEPTPAAVLPEAKTAVATPDKPEKPVKGGKDKPVHPVVKQAIKEREQEAAAAQLPLATKKAPKKKQPAPVR